MDRIVVYPDSILRRSTSDCQLDHSKIQAIVERLRHCMLREKHGIGIAAPQIGISERVAWVDLSSRVKDAVPFAIVNPVILEMRDLFVGREGCMSVPDYTAFIKRFQWIRFSYDDETGKRHEKISTGIEAVCVQHEIDHLDGKLLVDRVHCLKTDLLPRSMPPRK